MVTDPAVSTTQLHALLDEHGDVPTQRIATVLLVRHGVSPTTIAASLDVSVKTVYNWLDRFDEDPPDEAPFDDPRPGAPSELSGDEKQQLFETLHTPPSAVGYDAPAWSPMLVRDYIRETFDTEYSRRHVRRLMNDAGIS